MAEMPYDELLDWFAYFEERPVGWREDMRTVHLVRAQGVKVNPGELFPSLKPKVNPEDGLKGLKQSALFKGLLNATGGDKLAFLAE